MSKYHIFVTDKDSNSIFFGDGSPRRSYYFPKHDIKNFDYESGLDYADVSDFPDRVLIIPKEFT